jgi:3-methyladenine DNA glycosylase AlkD
MTEDKKNKLVLDITESVSKYVDQRLKIHINNDQEWKSHYNDCIRELKEELKATESVIKDYSEENLTVGRIEQEGYLRALKTMLNSFEHNRPDEEV